MKSDDERKQMITSLCDEVVDKFIEFRFHKQPQQCADHVFEYAREIISLGCFYLEFSDAIREGDGKRVLRCWRYLLPLYWNSCRTNYANEVLLMLYQHDFALSPMHASQLIWGRFVNTHGKPGMNIPADLHMEHLNRVVKEAIRGLGSNQTVSYCPGW